MSIAQHDEAILARLRLHPQLAAVVFNGSVPAGRNRYVNVFGSGRASGVERLDDRQIQVNRTYTIHCVSINPAAAGLLQDQVHAQLLNFRPVIPGRSSWRLSHEVSRAAEVDRDVTPPLWYTVDQFDLNTTPA